MYGQFIQISAFLRLGNDSYTLPWVSSQTAHDLMINLLGLYFDANVSTFLLSASISWDFFSCMALSKLRFYLDLIDYFFDTDLL